jgi:hypothetical protein
MLIIYVLPALLVAAVVVVALRSASPSAPSGPLALPPESTPDGGSASCSDLLRALPTDLSTSTGPAHPVSLAPPTPGAAAWRAPGEVPDPVVLRCGVTKPVDLTITSALIDINGVSWLVRSEPGSTTFTNVDRPVYSRLVVPRALGSGPVQTVSDTLRLTLPAQPVIR